ncbi:hypothetical protein EDD16DRAFT_1534737 [Pisolithus croceorrhizus]|nr:hypothetical protein EV401DRAFT_904728 [Pisolithus croceorrhizus]KAI6132132.1 hypothetical protein EDD16DRAFT_1534737 [Pisolithus croceorrhizus]KAI6144793.1 hypothetical protein EDD17DRAFT_1656200 [Pisolithus thermaeus]
MYWFEVQVYPTYSRAVFVPPFRVLGLITSQIPFYVQTHSRKGATDGPCVDILICLGKSCALWEGMKMTLLFVGPGVEDSMSCVAMDGDAIWCASGLRAVKYLTGKEVSRVINPLGSVLSSLFFYLDHTLPSQKTEHVC